MYGTGTRAADVAGSAVRGRAAGRAGGTGGSATGGWPCRCRCPRWWTVGARLRTGAGYPGWRVDYVVADAQWSTQGVIELNDRSHAREDRRRRDDKLAAGLAKLKIPLFVVEDRDAAGLSDWLGGLAHARDRRLAGRRAGGRRGRKGDEGESVPNVPPTTRRWPHRVPKGIAKGIISPTGTRTPWADSGSDHS